MLFRVAIILLGGGYVVYRVALALQIIKAQRGGDVAREQHLRRHGFGFYRWVAGGVAVLFLVLVVIVWANAR
jgi:hypothetical protein